MQRPATWTPPACGMTIHPQDHRVGIAAWATGARDHHPTVVPHTAKGTHNRQIATTIEGRTVLPGGIEPTGHLRDTEIGGRPVAAPRVIKVLRMADLPATAEDQEATDQEIVALGFTLGSWRPMAESAKKRTRSNSQPCQCPPMTASIG